MIREIIQQYIKPKYPSFVITGVHGRIRDAGTTEIGVVIHRGSGRGICVSLRRPSLPLV